MAIPKNVFLGLIYKFPFTGITALRLCVLTSKNVRLCALTQLKTPTLCVGVLSWLSRSRMFGRFSHGRKL